MASSRPAEPPSEFGPDGLPTSAERVRRRAVYERMLPRLELLAWQFGYALARHGSMTRDCDLVAVPWIVRHGAGAYAAVRLGRRMASSILRRISCESGAKESLERGFRLLCAFNTSLLADCLSFSMARIRS